MDIWDWRGRVRVDVEIDSVAGTVVSRGRKLREFIPDEIGCKVSCWE